MVLGLITDPMLVALVGAVSALFGASGVVAWFKLGPERGQITVSAAQGAVIVQATVLKDIQTSYQAIKEELGGVKREADAAEQAHQKCQSEIGELKVQINYLQRDLDRHGRMTVLARRKTHVAVNAIGAYELLVENILTELRDHRVPIKEELRPHTLRTNFQNKMNELEEMEDEVLKKAVESDTD